MPLVSPPLLLPPLLKWLKIEALVTAAVRIYVAKTKLTFIRPSKVVITANSSYVILTTDDTLQAGAEILQPFPLKVRSYNSYSISGWFSILHYHLPSDV